MELHGNLVHGWIPSFAYSSAPPVESCNCYMTSAGPLASFPHRLSLFEVRHNSSLQCAHLAVPIHIRNGVLPVMSRQ